MDDKEVKHNRPRLGRLFKQGIRKFVSLTLGESDFSLEKRRETGDFLFDPDCMEILEIDFDPSGMPRPKVFKLNLQVTGFFNRIKKNLRTINALYMVMSDDMAMQFESFSLEWKDRLIHVLNEEYHLELRQIHYIRESDILNLFHRSNTLERIKRPVPVFKTPYGLKTREFLMVAGGFINFKYREPPLIRETRGVISDFRSDDTIASVEVSFFKLTENARLEKIRVVGDYPVKYHSRAGAYFFIGGEWYHNLFLPELWDSRTVRYICFRIDDEGKYIRFFPDSEKRHIPLCLKKPVKDSGTGFVRLTYTINPEYLSIPELVDFKIGIRYESQSEHESREPVTDIEKGGEASLETLSLEQISREIKSRERTDRENGPARPPEAGYPDTDVLPFLLSQTVLLPRPGTQPGDIARYDLNIGDRKNRIRFSVSSHDESVTIRSARHPDKPYTRRIGDDVNFKAIVQGNHYTFSNSLVSRIQDDEMKLYFSWELSTTLREKTILKSDFYLIGRDPVKLSADQVIPLNRTGEEFWRIGASRNHAWMQKGRYGYVLFNISTGNSVFVIKSTDLDLPAISPVKLPPVSGEKNVILLKSFLAQLGEAGGTSDIHFPDAICQSYSLENNDLLIIGNRVFLYVQPVIVQSQLTGNARRFMKTVQYKKSQDS